MSWETNNFCFIMYLEFFCFPLPFFLQNLLTHNKEVLRGAREFGGNQYNFILPWIFPLEVKELKSWNGGNLGVLLVCPVLLIFILSSSAAWEIIPPTPNVKVMNETGFMFYFPLQLSHSAALQNGVHTSVTHSPQVPFCFYCKYCFLLKSIYFAYGTYLHISMSY